jgi:Secretion system C-terminal sorting domain
MLSEKFLLCLLPYRCSSIVQLSLIYSHAMEEYMSRTAVLISLFLLLSQPMFGQWTPDPSANTPLCTEVNNQTNAQIARSLDGNVIYVWQDQRSSQSTDIYAQRFDSLGMQKWGDQGKPVCTLSRNQQQVRIIPDGVGGAYLTWNDLGRGISIQRIDSTGNRFWVEQGIIVKSGIQPFAFPRFVSDSNDGVIVTWTDTRIGKYGVYAQRLNGQGTTLWNSQGVRLKNSPNAQKQPQIVSDNHGGAYVVWMESSVGIFAQAINPDGSMRWGNEGRVICSVSNGNENPRVITDGNDGLIVVWEDWRTGTESNIYGQRLNFGGNSLWDAEGKALCTADGDQTGLNVLWDEAAYFFVMWEDTRSNSPGLYMQSITMNGSLNWQLFGIPICTIPESSPANARMSTDDSGGAYVVWVDHRNVAGGQDLYTQRINPDGVGVWLDGGVPFANANANQSVPRIIDNGIGGAVVVWEDTRLNGLDSDLYTMGLRKDGLIPVELSLFTARMIDSQVLLRWVTESELNSFGFYVQRSDDKHSWIDLSFIASPGNSSSAKEYRYVDNLHNQHGEWFYRLKQIDHDGSFEYSPVLKVANLEASTAKFHNVYPQPATTSVTATFTLPVDVTLSMHLYDALGKRVHTIVPDASYASGTYSQSFDISHLPAGVYQLRMKSSDYLQSIPLIVR